MNIFESLKKYANQFVVANRRKFSKEEQDCVDHAEVKLSQYGMSVCFYMKSGCQTYIPLSRDSVAAEGDKVDLTKAELLTLKKEGSDETIDRVEI